MSMWKSIHWSTLSTLWNLQSFWLTGHSHKILPFRLIKLIKFSWRFWIIIILGIYLSFNSYTSMLNQKNQIRGAKLLTKKEFVYSFSDRVKLLFHTPVLLTIVSNNIASTSKKNPYTLVLLYTQLTLSWRMFLSYRNHANHCTGSYMIETSITKKLTNLTLYHRQKHMKPTTGQGWN